ncbi:HNH endonuclease [Arthrobacter globiformis]|uniref:HNH endonuclease n=1 Tax=Arthrobacter globiformis TaxID=1665 RepID=UPI001552C234|nr:HNH endonuclease signature motif containing protein [Arthrobacter globiformis]
MGSHNNTIGRMWENWHLGVYSEWKHPASGQLVSRRIMNPSCRELWVRSFNEESGMPVTSKVREVANNGVQTTFRVATAYGNELHVTTDHKLFTPTGWKRPIELSAGDYVYRQSKVAIALTRQIPPRLREGIGIWTQLMREELIPHEGVECYLCGNFFERSELHLDHVVPVATDLELALRKANLKPTCTTCHRQKTDGEQSIAVRQGSRIGLRPEQVTSISDPVNEETYHLFLDGPHHNFVAEGLIVQSHGYASDPRPH